MAKQMNVLGEGGRERSSVSASAGMRQVRIFRGPRDNYDETSWEYLDPEGSIRGTVVSETANSVIVEYPEERYSANQKAAEELAAARVSRAAPVGDASVSQNTVGRGEVETLEAHMAAAREDAAGRGGSGSVFDG